MLVPDRAEASLDARLVRGEDPQKKFDQIVGFIRKQGYYVIDRETDHRGATRAIR